jgi:hypothetical protein
MKCIQNETPVAHLNISALEVSLTLLGNAGIQLCVTARAFKYSPAVRDVYK